MTAILAGNDELAIGVLRAMYEAGRAIPGDVSVIGFDDAPQSAYLTPALTTVRQDFTGLGRACFALLLEQLGLPVPTDVRPVAIPELVLRESTSAPR